jgi:hypothetical protein
LRRVAVSIPRNLRRTPERERHCLPSVTLRCHTFAGHLGSASRPGPGQLFDPSLTRPIRTGLAQSPGPPRAAG